MQAAYKVEIIISTLELTEVIDILDTLKFTGYTVIKNVSGKGERGFSENDLGRVFSNSYIVTACTNEKQLNFLIEEMKPLLKKVGGVFLMTDVELLEH